MNPNEPSKGATIRFHGFEFGPTSFSCTAEASDRDKPDVLHFSWDGFDIDVDADSVALALSTLCGTKYVKVGMELVVSESCRDAVAAFTRADVSVKGTTPSLPPEKRDGPPVYLLNFSGGFDSLAAKALLPQEATKLVAIDFGGWFQREADFFQYFNPIVLKTDFRALKYDRASWTFMGAAAILFAKGLKAPHNVFGTILEAAPAQLAKKPGAGVFFSTPPFSDAGLSDVRITNGLTEVGTAMTVLRFFPEIAGRSLESLARPGSIKSYRKHLLIRLASKKLGITANLPSCKEPDAPKPTFGQTFGEDFLTFFEAKHLGRETAGKLVRDIPEDVFRLADSLSLEFYEKLNTNFLASIPAGWLPTYLARLAEAGIVPYSERDWEEFDQVRAVLARYYPSIAGKPARKPLFARLFSR